MLSYFVHTSAIGDLPLLSTLEFRKDCMLKTRHLPPRWVNGQLEGYGLAKITNFHSDWRDGRTITALTDSLQPGMFPLFIESVLVG